VLAGDVYQTELSKGSHVVEEYQLLLDSLLSGVEEQCRRSYEKENADMLREEGFGLKRSPGCMHVVTLLYYIGMH